MRTLEEVINSLPPDQRDEVTAGTQKLIAEEMALRQLRQARKLTQVNMANLLGLDQGAISKLESRSDMLLSTLRSYVEAMGGSLRLIAEFGGNAVEVSTLGEMMDSKPVARKPKAGRRLKRVNAE